MPGISIILALVLTVIAPTLPAQSDSQSKPNPEKMGDGARAVWEQLAARYDKNQDGQIAGDEYERGRVRFDRLDFDGDGVITSKDFGLRASVDRKERSEQVTVYRPRAFAAYFKVTKATPFQIEGLEEWVWMRDLDDNGKLAPAEMGAKGVKAGGRCLRTFDRDLDGFVSFDELLDLAEKLDVNGDALVSADEVTETRLAIGDGPLPGQMAPDFELPCKDGERSIPLSSFRGDRPVAIVFGSYT